MTIIFGDKDHWIDSIVDPLISTAAGVTRTVTITLTKPGHFVGAALAPASNSIAENTTEVRGTGTNDVIPYGTLISDFDIAYRHDAAGSSNMGSHVLIFMRN